MVAARPQEVLLAELGVWWEVPMVPCSRLGGKGEAVGLATGAEVCSA